MEGPTWSAVDLILDAGSSTRQGSCLSPGGYRNVVMSTSGARIATNSSTSRKRSSIIPAANRQSTAKTVWIRSANCSGAIVSREQNLYIRLN